MASVPPNLMEMGSVSDLNNGAMKQVMAHGQEILLARIGGKYYAVSNRCPHMGGRLSDGELEGTVVTCPRHGSQFDLTDGHVVRWTNWSGLLASVSKVLKSSRPLITYKVTLADDKIFLEI